MVIIRRKQLCSIFRPYQFNEIGKLNGIRGPCRLFSDVYKRVSNLVTLKSQINVFN